MSCSRPSLSVSARSPRVLLALSMVASSVTLGCIETPDEESTSIESIMDQRYYDSEDGTIADAKTWLVWQKAAAPGLHTWAEAKAYCAELDLAGGGWSLPTLPQLQSLVDGSYFPTIDPLAFPDTPEEWAWSASSSPYVGPTGDAWVVSFANGSSLNTTETDSTFSVRCVR